MRLIEPTIPQPSSRRGTLPVLAAMILLCVPAVAGQKPAAPPTPDAAVRAAEAAFREAFNGGKAPAVAACWTPDGLLVDASGRTFRGRAAIAEEYAAFFRQHPGMKLEIAIQTVDTPAPGMAIEDGLARLVDPQHNALPLASRYTAVHVLLDGKWQMASVRESSIALPSHYGPLRQLEWLVGDWQAQAEGVTVSNHIAWIADHSFLQRSYVRKQNGMTMSSGMQIIGYDAAAGRIRSWSFDSTGGNGSSLWTPAPDGWRMESAGQLTTGETTASVDFLVRVPGNHEVFGWRSTQRKIGHADLPDTDEVVLHRAGK